MKKLIAIAVAAICLVSASFALDLELGGKAILGRNMENGTWKENLANAKVDQTFDFGGSAYVHASLFGMMGIQAEANYIQSSMNFATKDENGKPVEEKYETKTLDLAPMLWWDLQIWKLDIGCGVGPNFSIPLQELGQIKSAKKDDFKLGLVAGADAKFYLTKNIGLVLSGRYIQEWDKKEVPIEVNGFDTGAGYPTLEVGRKNLYGGVGLELKLL